MILELGMLLLLTIQVVSLLLSSSQHAAAKFQLYF